MNLVQTALRRPLTILVLGIAVSLGAGIALQRMSRDVFPPLGIPTIYVAQPFGGMDPAQMEGYLTYYYEYHFLYLTGIEHVESKSIQGASLMKLQFHPGTDMSAAMSETVAYVNRARAFMPPGTPGPFITRFDAGSVPVGYLVFSTTNENRTVGQMQDAALNSVRPLFATLPGVSAPPPFGGSARTIVINVQPDRLRAYNLSPDEIVQAMSQANTISPSGNMNLGDKYPIVPVNVVVKNIKDLEGVPLRVNTSGAVFLRDVATVEDAADIVTSYALVNGRRTVYQTVTKRSDASTPSVVELVKKNLPKFQSVVPDDIKVTYEFDLSPVVRRSIADLVREGAIGAVLKQLTQAARHALEAQRQDSVLAAAQGYFELALAQGAVGVANEAVRIAGDYETQLTHAVEAGLAFKGDLLRARVQAERNRLTLRQAQEQQRAVAARLAQVLRLDPAVELQAQDSGLVALRLLETNAALTPLVQQALTTRPETKQNLALTAAAREAKNGATYGPLIPSLGAVGFWGGLGGGRSGVGDTFGGQQEFFVGASWRIGPGGLFDFGRVRSAEARLKITELSSDKVRDEITRQVVEAFTHWQSSYDQVSTAQRVLAAAEEGLRLAQQRKEFAVGMVLETITAEQDLTRARMDYLKAVAEFNRAQYALSKATGKL